MKPFRRLWATAATLTVAPPARPDPMLNLETIANLSSREMVTGISRGGYGPQATQLAGLRRSQGHG